MAAAHVKASDKVLAAIAKMAKGKSPGPDALPAEFYKAFGGALAPILTRVLKEARDRRSMPESMRDGEIILLYKKDSPSDIRNYEGRSKLCRCPTLIRYTEVSSPGVRKESSRGPPTASSVGSN